MYQKSRGCKAHRSWYHDARRFVSGESGTKKRMADLQYKGRALNKETSALHRVLARRGCQQVLLYKYNVSEQYKKLY